MIIVSNKFYSFLALLLVFLSLLGFQLANTVMLPLVSSIVYRSQTISYFYRGIVFVVSFILIVTTPSEKKIPLDRKAIVIYVIFMLIYFSRILIDIFIKDIYILPEFRQTIIQYVFIAMIPSIWATTRCARYIDYERLNRWLMWGGVLLLTAMVLNQNTLIAIEYDETVRARGGGGEGTISFGHTCVTLFIIFLSWIACHKNEKRLWNTVLVLLMLLSFVFMLRAGSRGPLVTFVVVILFLLFSRMKNKILGLLISLIVISLVWVNMATIIGWLGNISPMMEERMAATMYEDDSSGRDILYKAAIDIFLQNPIFGKQFLLNNGTYSHNSILDVMMGLGFCGVLIWIYLIWKDVKLTYHHVFNKTSLMIIGLLSIQSIFKGFLSGAMYMDNGLAVCMIIILSIITDDYEEEEVEEDYEKND